VNNVVVLPIERRPELGAAVPVFLTLLLLLWEAIRFENAGIAVVPSATLAGMLAAIHLLPLRNISPWRATRIYAWFLLASAATAYVDYEIMTSCGLWFSDRAHNDPAKYFDAMRISSVWANFNDPAFEQLLRFFMGQLESFGQLSYLGLLNCTLVLSSVFAACCFEIAGYIARGRNALPYLFVFNPFVIALNALLIRDILLGAVGWTAVIFGMAFLRRSDRSLWADAGLLLGSVCGFAAVYFLRTVSAAYFAAVTFALVVALDRQQAVRPRLVCPSPAWRPAGGRTSIIGGVNRARLNMTFVVIALVAVAWGWAWYGDKVVRRGEQAIALMERSSLYVEGSVGSRLAAHGALARTALCLGGAVVYNLPFWRVAKEALPIELMESGGSLFAQFVTALPLLLGLAMTIKRLEIRSAVWAGLLVGFCAVSGLLSHIQLRYLISHLLPVLIAIGVIGGQALESWPAFWRHAARALVIAALLAVQVMILTLKAYC
jgi:hypothetical protein